ncbi:hypothetical protein E4U45_006288 [Claviceps purpurea]|nr:hypothetical protein E4U45_006288 [Claviceps purpurea]
MLIGGDFRLEERPKRITSDLDDRARREDHPLTDDAPAMMDPNSIPRILLPMLPSTDLSTSVSTTAAGTVKAESAGAYSGPLSLVIAPLPTPTSSPGLDTARDGHTEAATVTIPATSMTDLLSSAVSASSTQPLIVGIFPTESTSAAGSTELPQGTDGAVFSTPSGGGLTDVGADPPLSTSVSGSGTLPTAVVSSTTSHDVPSTTSANVSPTTPDNISPTILDSMCPTILGNVPLTTPDNVLSTTSGTGSPMNSESISSTTSAEAIYSPINSNTQLPTSPDVSPPYFVPGSTTEPAATDRIPSPTAGNTSTTLLSTADQNTAPIALPTDGLLATTTCETAQITSSLPPTQAAPTIPAPQESSALTPPILNPAAPTSTSSSTSTPTSAEFPSATSFEPTSTTTAAAMPTATSSIEPVIYSHNLAQAKNLNKVYSNLTDHSPCSGTQTACIGGKTGKCIDGAFVFTDCPAAQRCYALPRTDNRGTRNACVDPAEAVRILGSDTAGAEDGTTSTGSAPTDPVPSTFRTETKRTTLTYTRVIVVTDMPSGPETEVPTEPTAQPERHGNTFIAVTSLVPSETGGMTSITLVSSSASANSSPFSSSVSSSSSSSPSEPSLLLPSSPTPSPSELEPEPTEAEPQPSSEPSSPAEPFPSLSSSPSSSPPPLASSSSSPSPSPPLPSPPSPLIPSSPTPRPTTTPLPDPTTTNQPSFIVVIQTFGTPTQSSLTTTFTATTTTPGRLVLIPVELSSLPSLPAIAGITTTPPIPKASPIGSIHLASGHAGPAGPESGSPHTTVTSNGTPTVSVYFTVTVTQKEKEMVTMKEKETVTVTVTAMPTGDVKDLFVDMIP